MSMCCVFQEPAVAPTLASNVRQATQGSDDIGEVQPRIHSAVLEKPVNANCQGIDNMCCYLKGASPDLVLMPTLAEPL